MGTVHVVLPGDIDDPAAPSGGNRYDRRICAGLAGAGWTVREHGLPGAWPHPGPNAVRRLTTLLAALPDGATVLVDGLVAVGVPEPLTAHAARLRTVVLAHMVFGDADAALAGAEHAVLTAARAVVTTSRWCRERLISRYGLPPATVHAAPPGADPAAVAPGTPVGTRLLCVAAVAAHKGHDTLVAALTTLTGLDWDCTCVGPLDRDPAFTARLRADAAPLAGRLHLTGPRTGPDLDAAYAAADLLVLASRGESYGMVITEALARGVPVLATDVQGLPEALGRAPDGTRPGLLVPPGDPAALAAALRRWLTDPGLRTTLRRAALGRRATLTGWDRTTAAISGVLASLPAEPALPGGRTVYNSTDEPRKE
ncbi:glycosyltransferase family 4 protein [Catellatospora sp. TT07R-123]|uniref:glycosyltransferase family 4 protein n=1 Tax=Catellatospora sp. TT07R-123 TaxID=2733863 RepID=UPI001BB31020|nr:glycosyltransferase family 4 protein [Catellatospora sp. TT07R-123]